MQTFDDKIIQHLKFPNNLKWINCLFVSVCYFLKQKADALIQVAHRFGEVSVKKYIINPKHAKICRPI